MLDFFKHYLLNLKCFLMENKKFIRYLVSKKIQIDSGIKK